MVSFLGRHPQLISMKERQMKGVKDPVYAILSATTIQEDIQLMTEMGVDAYRLSFAWSRILPAHYPRPNSSDGTLKGGVNKEGIDYYNKASLNELLASANRYRTRRHTLPLGCSSGDDFVDYANICFKEFGDRVKHWITLNEPRSFSVDGYAAGMLRVAPGRCSDWEQRNCSGGDSATEPYIVSHHQLLAHAAAVKLYRETHQPAQKGVIGISLSTFWMKPLSDTKSDQDAAQRALDFSFGWFLDPLTNGNYPESMRSLLGSRLPKFSEKESELLKGSMDFLGLQRWIEKIPQTLSLVVQELSPPRHEGNLGFIKKL
ncbi:hypothetical protein Tsubulata_007274, partial [Turnera subulata]